MTLLEEFAQYLEEQEYGTVGETIYLGSAPLDAPDKVMWIVPPGGANIGKNITREKQKNYIFNVYFRDTDAHAVDVDSLRFEEFINENNCVDLGDYVIIESEATGFPSDQDLESEDRSLSLVQITLTVYK